MRLTWVTRELHPRRVFRISRARRTAVCNVFVRIAHDGVTGYGEASPNAFYDETWEGVGAKLDAARDFVAALEVESVADIERAWAEVWPLVAPSRAAQCALDLALWDWLSRWQGVTASELAWAEPPEAVTTFCTLGLSAPDELGEKVEELRGFPRIKIKSDATASAEVVRFVRERSEALLAVDANCSWGGADIAAISGELARLGVAFIEQPLPPEKTARLGDVRSALPLMADESCVTEGDVDGAAGHFAGFNIKLVKCGGVTPALRMVRRGRALGRQVMVGCMLESSALIAAGAVIAQRADYADLDGAWLLRDDPFRGWLFERGILTSPDKAGLGIEPEAGLFEQV